MEAVLVLVVALVVVAVVNLLVIRSHLIVVPPNRVAVISGRSVRQRDGSVRGYRLVKGGRTLRIPIIEHVDWMDLTNRRIEVKLHGVPVQRGLIDIEGVANVKVAGEEPLVCNAVERFLGQPPQRVARVATEQLEGTIREVVARLSLDEVRDTGRVARYVSEEADFALSKLGLVMDTVKLSVDVRRAPAAQGGVQAAEPVPGAAAPTPGAVAPTPEPIEPAPAASGSSQSDEDLPPWARR
jgi:flotillin